MHEGHRERMRNKYLQNGIGALADHEVLEMLLFFSQPRVNTNETAHRLLETFHSFDAVLDADIKSLCDVPGMGEKSAVLLHLIKDCFNVYNRGRQERRAVLQTAMDAGDYALRMVGDQTTEGFYVICLDPSSKVLSMKKVLDGSVYRVLIDTRKVVEYILNHKAYSVILVHNHPFGPVEPSDDDIILTRKMQEALGALDISVVDHIIVGDDCFYSMAAHAQM